MASMAPAAGKDSTKNCHPSSLLIWEVTHTMSALSPLAELGTNLTIKEAGNAIPLCA